MGLYHPGELEERGGVEEVEEEEDGVVGEEILVVMREDMISSLSKSRRCDCCLWRNRWRVAILERTAARED